MRILIVDDSKTAAKVLRSKLEALGFEVVETHGGQDAWRHLQEQRERLVITDWMMPDMDGIELCKKIRTLNPVPYTYVVLLTVKDLRKDRLQGLEAGADDYLMKPVDSTELAVCLQTACRILASQDAALRLTIAPRPELAPSTGTL